MSDFESKTAEVEMPTSPLHVGQTTIAETTVGEAEEGSSREAKGHGQPANGASFSLRRFRAEAEMEAISLALQQTGWHRKRAAQLLRISYRCLLYKIHQYKITPAQTLAPSTPVSNVE
jgi:two-component system response regulator AtoC